MTTSDQERPVRRLEEDWACLSCGYNLRGLATTHKCPECGFEYDPRAVIIALQGKQLRWWGYYAVIGVIGACLSLVVVVFGGKEGRSWLFGEFSLTDYLLGFAELLTVGIIGACVFPRIWRRLGRKLEIRINKNGVQFLDPSLPRDLISWDRIREAECLDDGDELVLRGTGGESIVKCPREIIGERPDLQFCARQINALRDKYCGNSSADKK